MPNSKILTIHTEEDLFRAYEEVRVSGRVNMFDRTSVCMLSGLSVEEYHYVLKNYTELRNKYDNKGEMINESLC